ncbi:MAG: Lrp/AsnC family transcriptional regulator [Prolixibacteraceae bacterium]|nr:Lrp/AsnC family transcriptional regulator [Prolixibacteraceae bacterium]
MTEENIKTEKKIIEFLNKNGPSFMGEVVEELKISYSTGLNRINSLLSKGVIRHSDPPLQFEINSELK